MTGHNGGIAGAMVHAAGPSLAKAEAPLDFTTEQRAMISDTFANGASDSEFAVLMEIARARRLNPLLKQIHFVKRWDSQKRRDVWSAQAAIDGLRAIAQRTGLYGGQDEAEFVVENGRIIACKVRVYRKDWMRPSVGVAYWDEYVQTTRDGAPTRFWQTMPHNQLAKCAEALALRKAFPEDMSGIYVDAEMDQADNEVPPYVPQHAHPALSAKPHVDAAALLTSYFDRIDAAESGSELNAVASGSMKAMRDHIITDADLDRIAVAVATKRKVLRDAVPTSLSTQQQDGQAAADAGVAKTETREPGEEG